LSQGSLAPIVAELHASVDWLALKPFVDALNDHDTAWLVIAMASTLAGNFTVLGSIASLIVVQRAAVSGVTIGFWDYFRVGAPLSIITLSTGTLWLWR
jgi:Na+/H+ antiporter NhaD/arsenite permease-like protein